MARRKRKLLEAAVNLDVMELPANERGLAPAIVERFDRAQSTLVSPLSTDRQRDAAFATIKGIQKAPQVAAERMWRADAMQETVNLAEARGEAVERVRGETRVSNRDGLRSAFTSGKLTLDQYETGLAFRRAWQARSADVGSQLGSLGQTGSDHNNSRFVANRAERAFALAWLGRVERKVAIDCSQEPTCLQMLRRVAGDGVSLSHFGEGRAFDRHLKALARALDVAAKTPRTTRA